MYYCWSFTLSSPIKSKVTKFLRWLLLWSAGNKSNFGALRVVSVKTIHPPSFTIYRNYRACNFVRSLVTTNDVFVTCSRGLKIVHIRKFCLSKTDIFCCETWILWGKFGKSRKLYTLAWIRSFGLSLSLTQWRVSLSDTDKDSNSVLSSFLIKAVMWRLQSAEKFRTRVNGKYIIWEKTLG